MRSEGPIRFGVFEVDLVARELRRRGVRVRLQEQPFRVLEALLERPGEVVTREELRERLWAKDEYVEFDASLNTAVQRIRQALGDSAESPRFIETIPRIGYKLIAAIQPVSDPPKPKPTEHPDGRETFLIGAAAAFAIGGLFTLAIGGPGGNAGEQPHRIFSLQLQPGAFRVAVSPNDRYIVSRGSGGAAWVRDLETGVDRQLPTAQVGGWPFWSPDSRSIAYARLGVLYSYSLDGNQEKRLAQIPEPGFYGAAWSPDGRTIVVSAGSPPRLYEVSADGGQPEPLFESPSEEERFRHPSFCRCPTRSRLLLYSKETAKRVNIVAHDLETGEQALLPSGTWPVYSSSEHVVYVAAGQYWAAPFDPSSMTLQGEPFPLALSDRYASPSVSDRQTLVYEKELFGAERLVWRGRDGRNLAAVGKPKQSVRAPRIAPDGKRIAAVAFDEGVEDIWLFDTERSSETNLTADAEANERAAWLPDGERLVYSALGGRPDFDIYLRRADGSDEPVRLTDSFAPDYGYDWTPDSRTLIYSRFAAAAGSDIWFSKYDGERSLGTPKALAATDPDELSADLSPDGRFVAFDSRRSGRHEVYVQRFPEGGPAVRVSTEGGGQPRWRSDGRELYYVDADEWLVAVPILLGESVEVGAPEKLWRDPNLYGRGHQYDVSSDGERFVVVETLEPAPSRTVQVIQNWSLPYRE